MAGLLGRADAAAHILFDRLGRSWPMTLGLIALVAALLLIPGQDRLPLTDRDEARYVLATKQMLETGDFLEPRNLDQPRWKKPAGIYWLQSAAALASGQGAAAPLWVYRLPSALGILAAALLTAWATAPLVGRRAAAIAGIAVASAAVAVFEGHIAKTDAALLAIVVLAQGALVRALDRVPELGFAWPHALFWAALAAGVLVKGPIVLVVAGGTLLWLVVTELSIDPVRRTKPWPGLLLFALATLPWAVAIGIRTDWAFYAEAIGRDLLGKVDGAAEGHVGPPGYYLMTAWVTFWPWAPLALLAVPAAWGQRRSEGVRFLAGWIVPTWAVFAVATTKLPHYILPVLPAIGAFAGLALAEAGRTARPVLQWLAAVLFLLGALVVAVAAIGAPLWFEGSLVPTALGLALAGLVAATLAALALGRGHLGASALLGIASAVCLYPALVRETLPRLDSLFLSRHLAELDAALDACADRPVVSTGYEELSLAFLAGTDTVFGSPADVADRLAAPGTGWRVFATDTAAQRLAAAAGAPLVRIAEVVGINYNKSPDPITVGLYARADDPTLGPCLPR